VTTVSAQGVRVTVPSGWEARIFRRPATPPETTHTVVHLANFPLPSEVGDYGDGAVELMGPLSVLACLVEFHPDHAGDALFTVPGPPGDLPVDEFRRTTLQHARPGHLGAQRFFNSAGRAWSLFVVLGSEELRARLVATLNSALSTLQIGSHE